MLCNRRYPLLLVVILIWLPGVISAQVLLFPNGPSLPGEMGLGFAGAQTAFSGGAEAGWYNPAGYAIDNTPRVLAGFAPVFWQSAQSGGSGESGVVPGSGQLAANGAHGSLGYGWLLHWPIARRIRFHHTRTDVIDQADLPVFVDPGELDEYSSGIERFQSFTGEGRLEVLATGAGVGSALLPWLRIGAGLELQRVWFFGHGGTRALYSAESEDSSARYQASVFSRTGYSGVADRWLPIVGIQIEAAQNLVLGMSSRFASRSLGGRGNAELLQQSSVSALRGDGTEIQFADHIIGQGGGLRFALREPGELRIGMALYSASALFALDFYRGERLGSYTVLPSPELDAGSTLAFDPPPVRTSSEPLWRWAAGASFSVGNRKGLAFGLRDDRSAVPGDDPLYRRVHLSTASSTFLFSDSRGSGAVGLVYRVANSRNASFPVGLGDRREQLGVNYQQLFLVFSASWVL